MTLACIAGACAANARDTLYARLGGETGVAAIADRLVDRVAADPLTGPTFQDTRLERIKRSLAEQLCDLSGGPCRYTGDSMKDVHQGLHISQAQFYRLVETLRGVLQERGVDPGSTNELLRLLAPMKRDVVEPPPGKGGPARLPAAATENSNSGPP